MINVDAIKELIDQAPEIKTLFTIESYQWLQCMTTILERIKHPA